MTAAHIVDPARLLGEALAEASPDLMRSLLQTMINALLSADADAVLGADHPTIRVCLDVDASLRLGPLHLGARRSPVPRTKTATAMNAIAMSTTTPKNGPRQLISPRRPPRRGPIAIPSPRPSS